MYIYNLFICLLNSMVFFVIFSKATCINCIYNLMYMCTYLEVIPLLTAQCKPGEYSVSGLVPCSPCPRSSYQPQSMSSTCLACPPGKSSKSGSTMLSECKGKNQKICFDTTFFGLKIYG